MSTILSIQSAVSYGHVGNGAAVFALQRMGHEVYPVNTVNFASSTRYGPPMGPVIAEADIKKVIEGLDNLDVLKNVDAVLSGYQGSAEIGNIIIDAYQRVKQANPKAIYCADPVFGDAGAGTYVASDIPDFMGKNIIPLADVATPNLYELSTLTGEEPKCFSDILVAANKLRSLGPETVLVTSATTPDTLNSLMRMVAVDANGSWMVQTPLLDQDFGGSGSGDLTSAVFLSCLLSGRPLQNALSQTASVVYSILEKTAKAGEMEIALIDAQEDLISPTYRFEAEPID